MRIRKIEISNFKGFYDACVIELHRGCKNLLVYGENGSGKSSLFQALDLFLESDVKNLDFRTYRNIFATSDDPSIPTTNDGYIKLSLRDDASSGEHTYEWSPSVRETGVPIILGANKAKGFLDYKSLLETYFIHRNTETVNLFDLLINNLLANTINDITGNTFFDDWNELQFLVANNMTQANLDRLEAQIEDFNQGLIAKLEDLQFQTSEILTAFKYNLEISLNFDGIGYNYAKQRAEREITGQAIILRVRLSDRPFGRHHIFLNEAKLSAIALSIYLASLLLVPQPQLKLLVLDDVLIGLDMSNRLPVLDILDRFFPEHQIILTTYDRNWYEMVRLRTSDAGWKYIEFYRGLLEDFEIPIYIESQDLLDRARQHLNDKDYKACAVYVRTAFEVELKARAIKKKLKIPYLKDQNKLSSQDFWDAIKLENLLPSVIVQEIELYRKFILNPLSHAQLTNIYERELDDSITAVDNLRTEIRRLT